MIERYGFNPHLGHAVAFLDKTVYNGYLCLVASNQQQIYVGRSQTSIGKLGKWSTPKRVWICPKDSATVASSWVEDKNASVKQNHCKLPPCVVERRAGGSLTRRPKDPFVISCPRRLGGQTVITITAICGLDLNF